MFCFFTNIFWNHLEQWFPNVPTSDPENIKCKSLVILTLGGSCRYFFLSWLKRGLMVTQSTSTASIWSIYVVFIHSSQAFFVFYSIYNMQMLSLCYFRYPHYFLRKISEPNTYMFMTTSGIPASTLGTTYLEAFWW